MAAGHEGRPVEETFPWLADMSNEELGYIVGQALEIADDLQALSERNDPEAADLVDNWTAVLSSLQHYVNGKQGGIESTKQGRSAASDRSFDVAGWRTALAQLALARMLVHPTLAPLGRKLLKAPEQFPAFAQWSDANSRVPGLAGPLKVSGLEPSDVSRIRESNPKSLYGPDQTSEPAADKGAVRNVVVPKQARGPGK